MQFRQHIIIFSFFLSFIGTLNAASDLSNRRAPGFALPDLNVQYHDLYKYRGKVVIVNVMQTTCPHCKSFSKNLKRVADKYGAKIQVINIVLPPDTQQSVREYMNRMGSYTSRQLFLFDCGQVSASYLRVTPENPGIDTPHFFVIDSLGWIQDDYGYNALNDNIFTGEGLDEIINRYLPN